MTSPPPGSLVISGEASRSLAASRLAIFWSILASLHRSCLAAQLDEADLVTAATEAVITGSHLQLIVSACCTLEVSHCEDVISIFGPASDMARHFDTHKITGRSSWPASSLPLQWEMHHCTTAQDKARAEPAPARCGFRKQLVQGVPLLAPPLLALGCVLRPLRAVGIAVLLHGCCQPDSRLVRATAAACIGRRVCEQTAGNTGLARNQGSTVARQYLARILQFTQGQ